MLQLPVCSSRASAHKQMKLSLLKGFASIVSSMQNFFPNVIGNEVCDTVMLYALCCHYVIFYCFRGTDTYSNWSCTWNHSNWALCCKSSCVKLANAGLKETNSNLPSVRYMKIWYHFKHGWWLICVATSTNWFIDSSIHRDKCKPLATFRVIEKVDHLLSFYILTFNDWSTPCIIHLCSWGKKVTVSIVSCEFIVQRKVFYYSILSVMAIIEKLFSLSNIFEHLNLTISFFQCRCSKETQIVIRLWSIPFLLPWKPDLFGFIISSIEVGLLWE